MESGILGSCLPLAGSSADVRAASREAMLLTWPLPRFALGCSRETREAG